MSLQDVLKFWPILKRAKQEDIDQMKKDNKAFDQLINDAKSMPAKKEDD